jgi:hypothetical protein
VVPTPKYFIPNACILEKIYSNGNLLQRFKLQEEEIADNLDFWNQFYTLPASPDDIYSFIRFL